MGRVYFDGWEMKTVQLIRKYLRLKTPRIEKQLYLRIKSLVFLSLTHPRYDYLTIEDKKDILGWVMEDLFKNDMRELRRVNAESYIMIKARIMTRRIKYLKYPDIPKVEKKIRNTLERDRRFQKIETATFQNRWNVPVEGEIIKDPTSTEEILERMSSGIPLSEWIYQLLSEIKKPLSTSEIIGYVLNHWYKGKETNKEITHNPAFEKIIYEEEIALIYAMLPENGKKILKIMFENPGINGREISKKLSISEKTVYRMKKIIKERFSSILRETKSPKIFIEAMRKIIKNTP